MKRLWIILIVLVFVAAIATAAYLGFRTTPVQAATTPEAPPTIPVTVCDVEQTITAPGNLVNTNETQIEMPFTGKLFEVNVRAGDTVKAGQVLATLDGKKAYEAAVAAANLEVLQAQAALDELYANAPLDVAQAGVNLVEAKKALEDAQKARDRLDRPRASTATLDEAKARLALAEAQVDMAQQAYDGLSELPFEDPERARSRLALANAQREYANALATVNWYLGKSTEIEISLADATLAQAQAEYDLALAAWDALQKGPDNLKITLAEAQLANAQAKLTAAQDALTRLTVTAPFDGMILEAKARASETIPATTPLFTINSPQAAEVETTVIEEDLPYIEIGQPAEVYFDALPGETITGTVNRIVPKRAPGDRPLYYVYLTLDHIPAKLFAGMSADASVTIAKRQGALCLPRALAQAAADGTATVEVWDGAQKQKRMIEVGLRGDTNVEILSGLKEGELVVAR
ncbi:MAG: efflux RND transporter periplasmic adaptor subunit [Chloroflexota bacterium]